MIAEGPAFGLSRTMWELPKGFGLYGTQVPEGSVGPYIPYPYEAASTGPLFGIA